MQIASPNWLEERDRLLADTQSFIRQVARDRPTVAAGLPTAIAPQLHPAPATMPEPVKQPPAPWVPAAPLAKGPVAARPVAVRRGALEIVDLRADLHARVAAFRSRQQALQAERDADYEEAIQRIRTVTTGWKPRLSAPPPTIDEPCDAPIVSDDVDEGWNRIWLSIVQVADGEPQVVQQSD